MWLSRCPWASVHRKLHAPTSNYGRTELRGGLGHARNPTEASTYSPKGTSQVRDEKEGAVLTHSCPQWTEHSGRDPRGCSLIDNIPGQGGYRRWRGQVQWVPWFLPKYDMRTLVKYGGIGVDSLEKTYEFCTQSHCISGGSRSSTGHS